MKNLLFTAVYLFLAVVAGTTQAGPAYFISIDGLQPSLLTNLKEGGRLDAPHGFSWLMNRGLVVERALPLVTSITAPSHVSTITCSPPSRHGIIANEFLQDGKRVSGFSAPMATEPLWRAAMRQGRKVLSLAYVGADGSTQERQADYGLAYPEPKLMGPAQKLSLSWNRIKESQAIPIDFILNPETQEKQSLHLFLAETSSGREVQVARSQDPTRDKVGTLRLDGSALDVYFTEKSGRRRRSTLRLLPGQSQGEATLIASKVSYNNAYPESFRAALDAQNLVWPDYSVKGLDLSLTASVEAQSAIDRFLTDVAVQMVPQLKVDIVLFYQPLLDTIGHELQGQLPQPFQSQATDAVTQAFVQGFRIIDQNLSRLLADADAATPIALMGDHGMDAVHRMVNVAPLLRPQLKNAVQFVTSGQLLLLYPAPGHSRDKADAAGVSLQRHLADLLNPDGIKVLASASRARNFKRYKSADYQKEWQYGDAVWAFQGAAGDWLTFDANSRQLFLPPRASGMHGTSNSVSAMATTLLIHGPGVTPGRRPEGNLIQAVPTFAQLVGIEPPRNCLGRSLLPLDKISRAPRVRPGAE